MVQDRIYGKEREITIFRYRDSAPLPVRMRNRRYISYLHIIDFNRFIYLFYLVTYLFIYLFILLVPWKCWTYLAHKNKDLIITETYKFEKLQKIVNSLPWLFLTEDVLIRTLFLAHLSRRLTSELIGYPWIRRPSSSRCPFTFSNVFSSETAWPIKAKFYVEPPWEGGTKVCINGPGHMTKMAATPIYGKNLKKSSFLKKLDVCSY